MKTIRLAELLTVASGGALSARLALAGLKTRRRSFADRVCVLIALAVLMVPLPAAGAGECQSLDKLDWLLGDWTTSPTRIVIRESWRRVSDATFEGESITTSVADGTVVNYETLRLVAMSDAVFYIAKVTENDLPVPFRLTRCSGDVAVFENPAHDAPQRLIYRLVDPSIQDRASDMEVTLEGEGMKSFTLRFNRP